MLRFALAIALVAFCLLRPLAAEERVWTDTQGRTMRAEFLREVDGEAVFLKDGKLLTLPLERFTDADREVMKKLAAGKPVSEESEPEDPFQPVTRPPPPPPGGNFAPAPPLVKEKTEIVNREWIDIAGNRTTGRFVRVVGRDVLILRGVRTVVVAFDKLSFVDQAYVNQILEERDLRPLTPATTSLNGKPLDDDQSTRRPDQVIEPQSLDGSSDGDGPSAPGNSQFFRELRDRQEEARQQQAEFAETNPNVGAGAEPTATDAGAPGEATSVAPSAPVPKIRKINTRTVIKAETLAELRPVLIVGLVVIGLFGAVGVIVFIATSVAASNSARRQRRYL
jgi:hypothetical protein